MPFQPVLVHFQLKYCERCGGLWLRADGVTTPYCPVCEEFMAELPLRVRAPRRKNTPATPGAPPELTAVVAISRCGA